MAKITRFDPFSSLAAFEPLFDIDAFFRMPRWAGAWPGVAEELRIRIDVAEDEKAYRVKAEIPGVKKDDIKVSIDGNRIAISAEVKKEKEEKKGETVVRSERYYGKQYRAFALEHGVDQARADAKYENGVLALVLPKKEATSAKRIAVK